MKIFSEKAKTQFYFFFMKIIPFFEIVWKNVIETDRSTADDIIIRRRKYAICMPGSYGKNTHSFNTLFNTAAMVTRTCLIVTLYVHCLFCHDLFNRLEYPPYKTVHPYY